MLQRTFELAGGARLDLNETDMDFNGASGEVLEILEDLKENGIPRRGGSVDGEFAVEVLENVPANFYSGDDVFHLLERMGFSPREVYDYTDDGPPGG